MPVVATSPNRPNTSFVPASVPDATQGVAIPAIAVTNTKQRNRMSVRSLMKSTSSWYSAKLTPFDGAGGRPVTAFCWGGAEGGGAYCLDASPIAAAGAGWEGVVIRPSGLCVDNAEPPAH